ncbi:hypothetical protein [Spirosoma endophyticum]|uniref:Uncharacterized protein n=1 Tax=Spirosoma endophyticum TaxID=662367 RepID=A0A1I2GEV8_9BACT|nr:hypothetical protein [Spirosoma endophyticum]SFF15296.1 hypothetical protein SAMN05216167_13134 [Spirosoma endophyticum]
MESEKIQPLSRRKITIQANIWQHIKSIELGSYHQSLESYLEGICTSFTIYRGNDAALWLKSYLSSFEGWDAIRYKENNVFPNGSAFFKKYQEFGQRLWSDKKAQKILLDFLESGEAEYIDAINSLIGRLNTLPNWYEIWGEKSYEDVQNTVVNQSIDQPNIELTHLKTEELYLDEMDNGRLSHAQIAILSHLEGWLITKNNSDAIARKYGQTSGKKLESYYKDYTSKLVRTGYGKNTVRNYQRIKSYISEKAISLYNSELEMAIANNNKS